MGLLGMLFGTGSSKKVKEMLENSAIVIDVRSPGEYKSGHVAGSKNIPLQNLESRLNEFKKISKPIILCCASGARSGQATRFLRAQGISCENGGRWTKIDRLLAS